MTLGEEFAMPKVGSSIGATTEHYLYDSQRWFQFS